jgi:serine/threonine protein kinase/tetratricopeptide (TPR) repeat protein
MARDDNQEERTESLISLSAGTEISRYRIIEKIGAGGMGEVYLAEDIDLGRRVALKFLPQRLLSDSQAKARFERESRAVARLNHPNIVTIHEVGEYKGTPYFAMEYIEGESLDAIVKKRPLSPDEAKAIVLQVARGLLAAHDEGIIHRDIKPGNICIRHDGRAKILDFGLARIAGVEGLTESNLVLGTIGYNSPEQLSGDQIDHRTDIWSLGVVLYMMLNQQLPFKGDDAKALMYSIAHSQPRDISGAGNDVPHSIKTLFRRCLEKDPSKRPQSATEVLEILGVEPTSHMAGGRPVRRFRVGRLLPALFALIVITLGIVLLRSFLPVGEDDNVQEVRRIGVLPFLVDTQDSEASGWPSIIQMLFVSNMTGTGDIGIVDPLSLNAMLQSRFDTLSPPRMPGLYQAIRDADIAYVIDGTISGGSGAFQLHANVIEPTSGQVMYSRVDDVASEANLPEIVNSLSEDIMVFFETRILQEDYDRDVRPWLSNRVENLEAMKAFMQANEFLFKGIPGSQRYLSRALELDSSFVAPRIYLISGLVQSGRIEEARRQHQILLGFEQEANPFERSMISWAGALIDNNARAQVNSLKLALEYSLGNHVLLYELARSLYLLEDFEQVTEVLRPAIANDWQYSPAYYLAGISYCRMHDYTRARRVLEQSLSLPAVYPQTYPILASLALREGDRAAAERYEKNCLQTQEETGVARGEIHATLARSHLFLGLDKEAIRCYESAIAARPEEALYRNELGDVLIEAGMWSEAHDQYLALLALDADKADTYRMLGIINDSMADTTAALKYYNEYLQRDSSGAEAENIRGRITALK